MWPVRVAPAVTTSLLVLALQLVGPRALALGPRLSIRLHVRVARCGGKPVHDAAWVERQVAAANAIFEPHGIELSARQDSFTPDKCELLTRGDRDGLAQHVDERGVTVLVVQRVRDLDVPSYDLMGVHWRRRGGGKRWIYLTARARPPVLAHELGHYLGLRHDRAGGNLMTPGPSDPAWRRPKSERPRPFKPLFSARQARRLRAAARALRSD